MLRQIAKRWGLLASLFCFSSTSLIAQNQSQPDYGQIQGNTQVLFQQYEEDSLIRAALPDEKATLNSFTNLIYTRGDFSAGLRYESYLPVQEGYPGNFAGTGIGYRYAAYKKDGLGITIGNFYDQFGNGLIFRSYEERNLGLDNAMDGVKVSYTVAPGVYVKGVYGKMRTRFEDGIVNSEGYTRGIDGEVHLNDVLPGWDTLKTRVIIGGSFISKYQRDDRSDLVLPENVGAWALRTRISRGGFSMNAEFAMKMNDPYPLAKPEFREYYDDSYQDGQALLLNLVYATKGLSISLDAKTINNMTFRPDRVNENPTASQVNFLPAMTTQHTYILAGTFYPYATQPFGEVAYQAELGYKVPRKSLLGGKYGMDILVSMAQAFAPDNELIAGDDSQLNRFNNDLFSIGDSLYFRDFHVKVKKKFSKKFSAMLSYYTFHHNNYVNDVAFTVGGDKVEGIVNSNVFVAEANIKTRKKHNLRLVGQYLQTDEHQQDYIGLVAEYSISPHWIFAVLDIYNIGNNNKDQRYHYPFGSVTYINGGNRISAEYGRRREGVFCVGGICRQVPASNGLTLTITSSF